MRERSLVDKMFDFLPAIGKGNDELIRGPVAVSPDFILQPPIMALEKPDHAAGLSARMSSTLGACGPSEATE